MLKLEMVLCFYDCDTTTMDLSALDPYFFDEWDGFKVETLRPDWMDSRLNSRDLGVDLWLKIDGYQELDYIYKGLNVCVNEITKAWGLHDADGRMPGYKLFFNPYVVED